MGYLTFTLLFPLLGALAIAFIPANYKVLIRFAALVASGLAAFCAIMVFAGFQTGVAGYQMVYQTPWVQALGINFKVGVDGINVGLILLAGVVGFAATCVSRHIKDRTKEFFILLLVMIGGINGAFASLDIFFFFFFHELALIPTFIMIGVWGKGDQKNYATFKITLYLTAGALITLIGLVALYLNSNPRTFDMEELARQFAAQPLSASVQGFIFPFLLFGFGILVSLWPFHTWAPIGYASAPAPNAMLHAGVLKKFGLYGLLRIALPLLPDAAHTWMVVLSWLCLGNIVYAGFVAMRQRDLNYLIGNSSVAHMGFIFLGLASLTLVGVTGAVVIMVAHGFLAALSFAISGYIHREAGTLNMDEMGGFLGKMPFIGSAFLIAAMAGCGLPGFANFVGEAMTLFASWNRFSIVTSLAVWGGLVIGAVYMLRAVRNILHGPLPDHLAHIRDATLWGKVPFVILIAALLFFGMWPRSLTDKIRPSAELIVQKTDAAKPGRATIPGTVAANLQAR